MGKKGGGAGGKSYRGGPRPRGVSAWRWSQLQAQARWDEIERLQRAAEAAEKEALRQKNLAKQQHVARASGRLAANTNVTRGDTHKATWGELIHGTDAQGRDITARIGTGTNAGHVALSDGHKPLEQFRKSSEHDHYGPGNGPNNNGTARRQYNGVGSRTPDEEAQRWEREHGY